MNTQARDLGLGSGGFDVLYVNLTRGLELAGGAGRARDEAALHAGPGRRTGTPRRRAARPGRSTACPSSAARCTARSRRCVPRSPAFGSSTCSSRAGRCRLRCRTPCGSCGPAGSSRRSPTVGACFGGDAECVSVWSALAWAKARGRRRRGVRDRPGHRRDRNAARPRRDRRRDCGERGARARRPAGPRRPGLRGGSSASGTVASRITRKSCSASCWATWPSARTARDGERPCAGLPLSHMGRGPDDDPAFFEAAFAAGRLARGRRAAGRTGIRPRLRSPRVVDPSVIGTALPRSERDILVHGTAAQVEFENSSPPNDDPVSRLGRRRRRRRPSTHGSTCRFPCRSTYPPRSPSAEPRRSPTSVGSCGSKCTTRCRRAGEVRNLHLWDGDTRFFFWDFPDKHPPDLQIGSTELKWRGNHALDDSLGVSIGVIFPTAIDSPEPPSSFTLFSARAHLE